RVRIGAELEQRAYCRVVPAIGGDVERRAASGVLDGQLLAGRDQPLDLRRIALGGRGMQAGVDAQLRRTRRDLRRAGEGEDGGDEREEKAGLHPGPGSLLPDLIILLSRPSEARAGIVPNSEFVTVPVLQRALSRGAAPGTSGLTCRYPGAAGGRS